MTSATCLGTSPAGGLSRRRNCARKALLGALATSLATSLALGQAAAARAQTPPPQAGAEKPVIPQDKFGAAVPPLPPAGEAPEQAPAPPPTGQQPADDPELDKPLQPLLEFNTEPPAGLAAEPSDNNLALRYAIRIEGLDEAAAQSSINLAMRFDELSALKAGKGRAANEAMLSARLDEDSRLMQRLMFSQGWYDATIAARIDRTPGKDGALTAVLGVSPGTRYRLGKINVAAGPTEPPGLIERSLSLQPGEPLEAERVQEAEANIALVLPQNGYAFAETGKRDVELDPETHEADYTLPVTVGPRGRFGNVTTHGKLAFSADHAQVIARFKRGELYDSRKLDDLRKALLTTGLFASVAAQPVRTGQPAPDGTEYVDIDVEQHAGPPRTIAADLGYGSGEGFRVRANWTHRNLFPPEGALELGLAAGTDEQSGSVTFRKSNAGQRDRTLLVGLEAQRARHDAYNALTGTLTVRLSRDSTPLWQKRLTWALGAQAIGSIEEDYNFALGAKAERRFVVGVLTGQIGFDRTDSLLDPSHGYRLQLLVQPEVESWEGLHPYLRTQFDASAYHPVTRSLVVAGRFRLGSISGIDRFTLAPSRRYFAGGGGSVRGFAFQQLGPKDPLGNPLGGLSLIEGSAELRYRFGDFGVVGFVDAGQTYLSSLPDFSGIRAGVGVGVRYYTSLGPLRVDLATPLARRAGENRFNLYISIGQAF